MEGISLQNRNIFPYVYAVLGADPGFDQGPQLSNKKKMLTGVAHVGRPPVAGIQCHYLVSIQFNTKNL